MEIDLEPSPSPTDCSKDYWKLLSLLISISWPSLVTLWVVVKNIYSKMYLVSCTNTHRDVTDSVSHGMVKNTKTWISWGRNRIFLRNKKILNLCLKWDILRSYHFVAEVTLLVSSIFLFFYQMIAVQKICEKCFLFHLKSSFHFRDIPAIFNGWYVPFLIVLYSPFQKNDNETLKSWYNWLLSIGAGS